MVLTFLYLDGTGWWTGRFFSATVMLTAFISVVFNSPAYILSEEVNLETYQNRDEVPPDVLKNFDETFRQYKSAQKRLQEVKQALPDEEALIEFVRNEQKKWHRIELQLSLNSRDKTKEFVKNLQARGGEDYEDFILWRTHFEIVERYKFLQENLDDPQWRAFLGGYTRYYLQVFKQHKTAQPLPMIWKSAVERYSDLADSLTLDKAATVLQEMSKENHDRSEPIVSRLEEKITIPKLVRNHVSGRALASYILDACHLSLDGKPPTSLQIAKNEVERLYYGLQELWPDWDKVQMIGRYSYLRDIKKQTEVLE